MKRQDQTQQHYVYRWYAFTGQLLYVGCSVDPDKRWAELRRERDWTHLAARRSLELYGTKREARAAELAAIKTESPLFNVTGTTRRRYRSVTCIWSYDAEANLIKVEHEVVPMWRPRPPAAPRGYRVLATACLGRGECDCPPEHS